MSLKDIVSPYLRPMIEAVWSVHDTKPFWIEWGRTLRQGILSPSKMLRDIRR
ncbi:MAG: hypothetical protein JXA73_00715 [Acidobacteria bacterium]|nr:hypothetical protein [Acidobacteriota bacterium]